MDPALVVEADLVVDHEIVALAGDDHVVVAIRAGLGRTAGLLGDDGARGRRTGCLESPCRRMPPPMRRISTVTACEGYGQHLGHHVLDLGRVLGRGPDGDLVVLSRHGQGDLSFEVEMLLPADAHPTIEQAARCGGDGGLGVAAAQGERVGDERRRSASPLHGVEDGRQLRVLDVRQRRGAAGLVAGAGGDGEDRLADELDQVGRQQRLVVAVGRADIVLARHVGRGEHAHDTFGRADRAQVDAGEPGMRLGAEAELDMQQTRRLRQVVDVERFTGDVAKGAVMGLGRVGPALDTVRHGRGSGRRRAASRPGSWSPHAGAAADCVRP